MKKLTAFFIMITSVIYKTESQPLTHTVEENGIYLTSYNYVKRKLTNAFDRKEGHCFRLEKLHVVRIKSKDQKHDFYHDQIWGLRKIGMIKEYLQEYWFG